MGAKKKLNSANAIGALVVAGIIGLQFGSWTVFAITGIALAAAAFYNGDIRR